MKFVEITGALLMQLAEADEIPQLRSSGVKDDSKVRINPQGDIEIFQRGSWAVIGGLLGALAGYVGGWTDTLVMGAMDILLAFPSLILAIAIVTGVGGLALLRGNMGQNLQWNVLMGASMLTTLPMALIFLFFQRYFVQSIATSGISG